jgi:hypothetical protein
MTGPRLSRKATSMSAGEHARTTWNHADAVQLGFRLRCRRSLCFVARMHVLAKHHYLRPRVPLQLPPQSGEQSNSDSFATGLPKPPYWRPAPLAPRLFLRRLILRRHLLNLRDSAYHPALLVSLAPLRLSRPVSRQDARRPLHPSGSLEVRQFLGPDYQLQCASSSSAATKLIPSLVFWDIWPQVFFYTGIAAM